MPKQRSTKAATPVNFVLGDHGLQWQHSSTKPVLTNEQAMVVAVMELATSLNKIAEALHRVADAKM